MRVRWTKLAEQDLEEIEAYISADNPLIAIDTVLVIINEIEKTLPTYPDIGRPGRIMGTREFVVADTPYIVPYRINGSWVEILRVIHGARKWPAKI